MFTGLLALSFYSHLFPYDSCSSLCDTETLQSRDRDEVSFIFVVKQVAGLHFYTFQAIQPYDLSSFCFMLFVIMLCL